MTRDDIADLLGEAAECLRRAAHKAEDGEGGYVAGLRSDEWRSTSEGLQRESDRLADDGDGEEDA